MRLRPIAIALAAAVPLAGCATAEPAATQSGENPAEVEARLAGATFGRVPGTPLSCVSVDELRGNRALGSQLVLFQGTGARLYANRPSGCAGLAYNRALTFQSSNGRLCRGDIVQVVDPASRAMLGSCTLSDFLPFVPRG